MSELKRKAPSSSSSSTSVAASLSTSASASAADDSNDSLQQTHITSEADQRIVLKKQRTEETALVTAPSASSQQLIKAADGTTLPPRTSSLQAPTMQLSGHGAPILACAFDASGSQLASGGVDKLLFLWSLDSETGAITNDCTLSGHEAPILDITFGADTLCYTASADKTGAIFDTHANERVKRLKGHTASVNSISCTRRGQTLLATGSDDCSVKVHDPRVKLAVHNFVEQYQVLTTTFSDDGTQIFSAGIANDIKCRDLRTGKILFDLIGHRDTVTGISLSPDGSYLLSNSMDSTLRCWDVRPYVSAPTRLTTRMTGHTHDIQMNLLRCAWSNDGLKVAAGSADSAVNIWSASDGRILYRLPGHKGSVNSVAFHPRESIIASASNDKTIYVGEIHNS